MNENSFRKDSLALETIKALNLPKLLWMKELDILRYITADVEVIRYRQAIFSEIERSPALYDILKSFKKYIRDLKDMSQKRSTMSQSTEDVLYSFAEIQFFIKVIRDITSRMEEISSGLKSPVMVELYEKLEKIMQDESFTKIIVYVEKIAGKMRYAKSVTLGLNLNAKFEVYEVGVVSINMEPHILSDWFGTPFNKGKAKDDGDNFKCFTPLVSTEKSNHLGQVIYRVLNTDLSRAVLKAHTTLLS